jgi:DNA polymerase-3 subunit gamma/tau
VSGPAAGRGSGSGLSPEGWLELAPRLGLKGAVQNIALNCECRRAAPGLVELRLDKEAAGLFNPGRHPDMIRRALVDHLGEDLQVQVAPGVIESTTPAREQRREAAARQQQAVVEIESDPLLQQLIDRFDGELDRASIAPLDK